MSFLSNTLKKNRERMIMKYRKILAKHKLRLRYSQHIIEIGLKNLTVDQRLLVRELRPCLLLLSKTMDKSHLNFQPQKQTMVWFLSQMRSRFNIYLKIKQTTDIIKNYQKMAKKCLKAKR